MPFVTIKWFPRSKEMRAEVAKGITEAIVKITGADPNLVRVVFEDLSRDSYAQAGVLASERKK